METLQEIYNNKLRYNYYITYIRANGCDLFITFLGCDDFIISSNYHGVVALGRREYDENLKKAFYKLKFVSCAFGFSKYERLIRKHEKNMTNNAVINMCEVL